MFSRLTRTPSASWPSAFALATLRWTLGEARPPRPAKHRYGISQKLQLILFTYSVQNKELRYALRVMIYRPQSTSASSRCANAHLGLLVDLDVILGQGDLKILHNHVQRHWLSHVVGRHVHIVT